MNGMQYAIPSASYLLFIPLLFILAARLFVFQKKWVYESQSNQMIFLNLISIIPVVFLLAPTIYFTFIAFGLGTNMSFVVIATGLGTGLLLPVLYPCFINQKSIVSIVAFTCFLAAMVGGHLSSGFSEKQPLQSHLRYLLDTDSSKAKWLSDFEVTDKWSAGFFKDEFNKNKVSSFNSRLINDAPVLPLLPPLAVITQDTLVNGRRNLLIHFNASRENVKFINITISDSSRVNKVFIYGKEFVRNEAGKLFWYKNIGFSGITANGLDVNFEMEFGRKLDILLSDESIGLPVVQGFNTSYPKDIIPARGRNSNTTQVRKHFIF